MGFDTDMQFTNPVIMPAMGVSVVVVSRCEHPNEVDGEPYRTDDEELARVHLGRVYEALDGFEDNKDGDEAEEEAVGEA